MAALVWGAWSPVWSLGSKVDFDGINKIIFVHPDVTDFDIRSDLYSAWIDWISLYDNIKFSPVMRVTGFDPIGGGAYTGDVYFLINGWKLSVNIQKVKVTGVLYSDDYDTPYYTTDLVAQYPATVSALVTTISTGGAGASAAEVRQEMDARSTKLQQIQMEVQSIPTAAEIVGVMDSTSTKLAQIRAIIDTIPESTSSAVWNKPITGMSDKTTIGGYISRVLLSIPKYLGLK